MEYKQQQFLLRRENDPETEYKSFEMLKELSWKWFMETQAPLLLQNGTLPEWFYGFITRKQSEELLKDKDAGCFLIRLSDRPIGYILSYRGKDRCRHFVINHLRNGHYVISGDNCTHESLAELIGYYQTSEIEPFGEHLTTVCTQPTEKSVYDEISLNQQASLKQSKSNSGEINPLLIRQGSGSSQSTALMKEATFLPPKSKTDHRHFSGERKNFDSQDIDIAPPLPNRSSSLMQEASLTLKLDLEDEGNTVYAELNKHHLNNRGLSSSQGDTQQKPGEPDLANYSHVKKISSVYTLAKQAECFNDKKVDLTKPATPEIVYSEIMLEQTKSRSSFLWGQSTHSLPSCPSTSVDTKTLTLHTPASASLQLSPKLPIKTRTAVEFQGSEQIFATYAASLQSKEGLRKSDKILSDSQTQTTYRQTKTVKVCKTFVSGSDSGSNTYEQILGGRPKSSIHDQMFEKLSKFSLIQPNDTFDEMSSLNIRSSRTENCAENTYEKIPENFQKGLSAKQISSTDNTYKQISLDVVKGAEAKPNQKMDKRRRFFFVDKKNKS